MADTGIPSRPAKTGDVITFYGHRTKNGTNFMRLEKIVMSDGKELPNL